jgi:hypothetical protein
MIDILKSIIANLLTKPFKVLFSLGWKALIFGVPLLVLAAYLGELSGTF